MFRLPSTATTSLSVWPRIRCGNVAKWMNDGGRQRARYATSLPSPTKPDEKAAIFENPAAKLAERADHGDKSGV